ncbi:MAG: Hsp70 family protein, partial [Acidimicrobiia bacterium]|nr:Hsp70 family protein [Acidimicrobiia bacterium]
MTDDWVLAVDFGTTYTIAAVQRRGEPAQLVDFDGERRLPSVVFVDDDGSVLVGRTAEMLIVGQPDRGLRSPKALLGQPTPAVLGGQTLAISELVGAVLSATHRAAGALFSDPPVAVWLTHPADWNRRQLDQFLRAADVAGITAPGLVSEPEAAAWAMAANHPLRVGAAVLVFDLGGGTLDTAVLRRTESGFDPVGRPRGDR